MPRKPQTYIEELNARIRQRQKAGLLTKKIGTVIRNIAESMLPFPGPVLAARKVIEKKLAERKLTDDEYDIANRFLKDELSTPPARNVRGRFKYITPSSPEDKKEYKKGGPVKRKPSTVSKVRKGGAIKRRKKK